MTGVVRLGILGCGRAAERLHLPAIGRVAEARVVAVFDPRESRRELVAGLAQGCQRFNSAERLIEWGGVDALIIATPVESHVALAMLAVRAGVPVLIEKPLARSAADAEPLVAMARRSPVPVMVGFNRRWWGPAIRLRSGVAGAPPMGISAQMEIASDVASWSPVSSTSDPLEDLSSHHLDLLRYLTGREIRLVSAVSPEPSKIQLTVTLEGGTVATCYAAYGKPSRERVRLVASGRRYLIRSGSERVSPAEGPLRRTLDLADNMSRRLRRRPGSLSLSYDRQLRAFLRCLQKPSLVSPGVEDGMAVLRAIEAARASLAAAGASISPLRSEP